MVISLVAVYDLVANNEKRATALFLFLRNNQMK